MQTLKTPHLFNLPTEGWRGVGLFPFTFLNSLTVMLLDKILV
jgi:hypothetical protein